MSSSQSSNVGIDPLSDVLEALGARVSRLTRLEAAGEWSIAFPALDRLKFVALSRGTCWLVLPGVDPLSMQAGDVCLIGRSLYRVASDPALPPTDGQALYETPGHDVATLGGDDMVLIGGGVVFHSGNADFLLDMLPDFLLVPRSSPAAGTIATILALLDAESERENMGREIVAARLADVMVVEAIRAYAASRGVAETGWLGALGDQRLGRALRAIHADIARAWTVRLLADEAGMSRAAFAAEFARRVGQPPLAYVRSWRLTIARAALAYGEADVAAIAATIGYASHSAFGHAFRRAFGITPRASAITLPRSVSRPGGRRPAAH